MSILGDLGTKIGTKLKALTTSVNSKLGKTEKAADSDKFDGLNSTQFLRSDTADTMSQRFDNSKGIVSRAIDIATGGSRTIQGLANNNDTGSYGDLHLQHYGGDLHMCHGNGKAYINDSEVVTLDTMPTSSSLDSGGTINGELQVNSLIKAENGISIGTGTHNTVGRASLTFGEGDPTARNMFIEYDGENKGGDDNKLSIGSNNSGIGELMKFTYGGNITVWGPTEFNHDDGVFIKSRSNNVGAKLKFSDLSSSNYEQIGSLEYWHSDGAVVGGYQDGFIIKGSEPTTAVKIEGDLVSNLISTQGLKVDGLSGNDTSGTDAGIWVNSTTNNDWSIIADSNQSSSTDYGYDFRGGSSHSYAFRGMKDNAEYFRVGTDRLYHNNRVESKTVAAENLIVGNTSSVSQLEMVLKAGTHLYQEDERHFNNKTVGLRRHVIHYNAGSAGATIPFMRIKRQWWGSGNFRIETRGTYYSGSNQDVFQIHGHCSIQYSGSMSIAHIEGGSSGRITVSERQSASPANSVVGYTDVSIVIPAYNQYTIIIEVSGSVWRKTDDEMIGDYNSYRIL
jgi:hypothetical protein